MGIALGRYRHYKGGEYDVLGTVLHSETEERMVLYRPRYGERELWVRPLDMFQESVDVDGKTLPRFALVEAAPEPSASPQSTPGS